MPCSPRPSRPPLKFQRGIINALLSIEGHLVWLLNVDNWQRKWRKGHKKKESYDASRAYLVHIQKCKAHWLSHLSFTPACVFSFKLSWFFQHSCFIYLWLHNIVPTILCLFSNFCYYTWRWSFFFYYTSTITLLYSVTLLKGIDVVTNWYFLLQIYGLGKVKVYYRNHM